MRNLSKEELDLIIGGTSLPGVTIIGSPTPDPDWPPPFEYPDPPGGGGGEGGGGGGGGGGDDPDEDPCQHTSPPPSVTPAGTTLEAVRDIIADIASTIRGMQNYQTLEYGAVVVRQADGTLRSGDISIGTVDHVNISIGLMPGETIVAYIHSHPVRNDGVDNGVPSNGSNGAQAGGDTGEAARLLTNPRTDPGGLMYILDANNGGVYEYTMQGGENRTKGPDIARDTTCGH